MTLASNPDEWSRLLNGMADETLSEHEQQRLIELLHTDDEFRREYVQYCMLVGQLNWQLSAGTPVTSHQLTKKQSAANRRFKFSAATWLITAAIMLSASLWLSWSPISEQPVARIVRLSGQVKVIRGDQELTDLELENGIISLQLGDEIVTQPQSTAGLVLSDQTQVRLNPDSKLILSADAKNHFKLLEGNLSAEVTPQSPTRPLTFGTPNAQVQVIGTKLEVLAMQDYSEVAVSEGTVRVARNSDGANTTVSAGQFLSVSESEPISIIDWAVRPETWDIDFESGLPTGWTGRESRVPLPENSEGAISATPIFRDPDQRFHIRSPINPDGLFSWHDDSVLHLTFQIQPPGWFHIYLYVRTYDQRGAPSIFCYANPDLWQSSSGKWTSVSIPLSEFRVVGNARNKPTLGRIPIQVVFSGESESGSLVIDHIWIDRGKR